MATAHASSLLGTALTYAGRGWQVFPCHTPTGQGCSCRKNCGRDAGKHPRTPHGLKDATTDEAAIRRWWKMWPQANIGLRTGAVSGIVVLDRDDYKGGQDSLEELEQSYSPLPETVLALTGGGGQHYVFAHPGSHVKTGVDTLGPGLDTRADGGYIIAPPSLHKSGKRYAWEVLHEPDETPVAPMPDWLLALCQEKPRTKKRAVKAEGTRPEAPSQAYAEELLGCVPNPGADRDTWSKVGMALHATMEPWAYDLWDIWSQQYPEKYSASDQEKAWKSFSLDGPAGKAPITFGTLVHLARLNGYQSRNGDTAAPAAPDWTEALSSTKAGVKETFNNIALALEYLDPWATQAWFDVVRDRAMVGTQPFDDPQVWTAARAIEQQTGMPVRNLRLITSALRSRCHAHPRDTLRVWLEALPAWDHTDRLTEYLADHASVPKTAYTMAAGRLLIVSMVARALHPGIQCRSVIILEGKQDIGKSRMVKTLAGEEWYREVSGTLEGKEAHMLMKGAWVVELSEMDVMLRTEESRVKSFITMCNDEFIPKYANDPVKLARRTILVGTINPEGDGSYLRDQTGATRYYPVPVGTIALHDIAACREQLFAEALVWFRDHPETWWQMPAEAKDELDLTREARRKEGVFEGPRLQEWLAKVKAGTTETVAPFHTEDALRYCFNIAPDKWTDAIKDRVGKAIGKSGWYSKTSRDRGEPQRLWHRQM